MNLNQGIQTTIESILDFDGASAPSLPDQGSTPWEERSTLAVEGSPPSSVNATIIAPAGPILAEAIHEDSFQQPVEWGGAITSPSAILDGQREGLSGVDLIHLGGTGYSPLLSFGNLGSPCLLDSALQAFINPSTPSSLRLPLVSPSLGLTQPLRQIENDHASSITPDTMYSELEDFGHVEMLSIKGYENLNLWIDAMGPGWEHDTGADTSAPYSEQWKLPSLKAINAFVQLYFENFHDVLPIIHRPTFDPNKAPALLVLAIANIGSRFSNLPAVAGATSDEFRLNKTIHLATLRHVGISSTIWQRWDPNILRSVTSLAVRQLRCGSPKSFSCLQSACALQITGPRLRGPSRIAAF